MALFELFSGIVSAVVGAVVSKIIKLLSGRKTKEQKGSAAIPTQTVIAVAPTTLVQYEFPLTSYTRDILEIPRSASIIPPRLILPGQGIVSRGTFLDHAMDSMVMPANEPVLCSRCGQRRLWGAFINNHWYCADHLYPYLTGLADGERDLVSLAPTTSSPWHHVEPVLAQSEGNALIIGDPTIRALMASTTSPRASGEFREFWTEHNVKDNSGRNSIKLHFSFVVHGCLNTTVRAAAFFAFESGQWLLDEDNEYRTKDGLVSVGGPDMLMKWHDTRCDGCTLTMPNIQLHLAPGIHYLKCRIGIYSYAFEKYLFYSNWASFSWWS